MKKSTLTIVIVVIAIIMLVGSLTSSYNDMVSCRPYP